MGEKLKGRGALVTGSASGIGKATALLFAREGASVTVSDVVDEGEQVAEQIRSERGIASFVKADVSRADEVEHLVDSAVRLNGSVDVACNNAGIEGKPAEAARIDTDDWNRILAVNLTGVFQCMRLELGRMKQQGSGAIVNVSSVAGLVGFQGMAAYTASKHGVIGLTRTAALDYAETGIRINAVCPGVIETPMIDRFTGGSDEARQGLLALEPMGRLGKPEEVAEMILWLCSEDSSFVTGQALAVDGGFTTR